MWKRRRWLTREAFGSLRFSNWTYQITLQVNKWPHVPWGGLLVDHWVWSSKCPPILDSASWWLCEPYSFKISSSKLLTCYQSFGASPETAPIITQFAWEEEVAQMRRISWGEVPDTLVVQKKQPFICSFFLDIYTNFHLISDLPYMLFPKRLHNQAS